MGTSTNPAGGRRAVEHLDADAVCAQCGTVNIEETLICKTCGNNLRDQRQMRLAAEAQMEGEASGGERRQFIRGALTVLGLLVVLWTALNVATIQQWMISAQIEAENPAEVFYFGEQSAFYQDLVDELEANLPTTEEVTAAAGAAVPVTQYDGYYVIFSRGGDEGAALLRPLPEESSASNLPQYAFVALLEGAEIRGVAQLRDNTFTADWNNTGVAFEGEYQSASGVVIQQADGSFDGFAQYAGSETGHAFTALKLPR